MEVADAGPSRVADTNARLLGEYAGAALLITTALTSGPRRCPSTTRIGSPPVSGPSLARKLKVVHDRPLGMSSPGSR